MFEVIQIQFVDTSIPYWLGQQLHGDVWLMSSFQGKPNFVHNYSLSHIPLAHSQISCCSEKPGNRLAACRGFSDADIICVLNNGDIQGCTFGMYKLAVS